MQTVSRNELKTVIKESVKEALEEELIKMRLMFFPNISDREMQDIADRYKKPENKSVHTEKMDI
ncbi:MAG: hypothetical protein HY026_03320 [Deltaproteobacteria bacterium]|nr:hypothetical protein [Deltaproteobacteria bacterium]